MSSPPGSASAGSERDAAGRGGRGADAAPGERLHEVGAGGAAGAPRPDRRLRGYAEIAVASLILGTSATLIQVSTMPASLLVVGRMGLAGVVLAVVFFLTGGVDEVRRSGRLLRLVLIGVVVAVELLLYYAAIRLAGVTVGIALEYMAPVWVAVAAPWLLRTQRRRSDLVAVGVAVAGMALIVVPSVSLSAAAGSVPGVVCGVLASFCYAAALMLIKSVGEDVRGLTFTLFYCAGSVVILTPLAVWQAVSSNYHLTGTDLWIVVVSGLVYTALCFTLFSDGIRHAPVEHAGILGYLEPVTAPLWAWLFIGEVPPWTTAAGGALIVAAGIVVVVLGKDGAETVPEPLA